MPLNKQNNITIRTVEGKGSLFELLFEKVVNYTKINIALFRLQVLDKTSDIVSSLIPRFVMFGFIVLFLFFLSLGLALWLGDILGKTYIGFFILGGFYGIAGIIFYGFMDRSIKKFVYDYFIEMIHK